MIANLYLFLSDEERETVLAQWDKLKSLRMQIQNLTEGDIAKKQLKIDAWTTFAAIKNLTDKANRAELEKYSDTPEHLEEGALTQIERVINYYTYQSPIPKRIFFEPLQGDTDLVYTTDLPGEIMEAIKPYMEKLTSYPEHQGRLKKAVTEATKPYPKAFIARSKAGLYDLFIGTRRLLPDDALLMETEHGKLYDLEKVTVIMRTSLHEGGIDVERISGEDAAKNEAIVAATLAMGSPAAEDPPTEPPKKAGKARSPKEEQIDLSEQVRNNLVPNSAPINLMQRILMAGGNQIGELEKTNTGRKSETFVLLSGNTATVTHKTSKEESTIICNADILPPGRNSSNVRKWLTYLLKEVNLQCLSDGEVTSKALMINYKKMVELKMYSSPLTAKRGFWKSFEALKSISYKGYIERRGKKQTRREQKQAGVLFYNAKADGKGNVVISINDEFKWELLTTSYTVIPPEYYSLEGNAADLFYYIFYLARQNHAALTKTRHTHNGKEEAYFTISYRAIQEYLRLPNEGETTNDTAQIKAPIEKAIGDILDKGLPYLELEAKHPEMCSIEEYLNKGKLKVILKGDYLNYLLNYFKKVEKRITNAAAKKRKLEEAAKVKALQAKMEKEEAKKK